jgi:hypothetical protein
MTTRRERIVAMLDEADVKFEVNLKIDYVLKYDDCPMQQCHTDDAHHVFHESYLTLSKDEFKEFLGRLDDVDDAFNGTKSEEPTLIYD